MKKIAIIVVKLLEDSEAYEGKSNTDIEKEIIEEIGNIPYMKSLEKVTVLDCSL